MLSNVFTTNREDILKGIPMFVYAFMWMTCSSLVRILKISTKQRSFISNFDIKDLVKAGGVYQSRSLYLNKMALSKSNYIEKVLSNFNHFIDTLVATPLDSRITLIKNQGKPVWET